MFRICCAFLFYLSFAVVIGWVSTSVTSNNYLQKEAVDSINYTYSSFTM